MRAHRLRLSDVERTELGHSGFIARADGSLEVVLYFDDDRPDYAVAVPRFLAWLLKRFLERAMVAIDPLLFEDSAFNASPGDEPGGDGGCDVRRAGARRAATSSARTPTTRTKGASWRTSSRSK